jgi:hypothetical protein
MAQSTARYSVPAGGKQLARRTANGVLAALIPLFIVQIAVDAANIDVGATGAMSPFAAGPLVGATVVAGAGAAVVYALLVRFTAQPARNFVVAAVVVFVLMLVPVFAAPPEGITQVGQGILIVYHLIVAVSLVAFLVGTVEL